MEENWDKLVEVKNCPFDNINKENNPYLIFVKQLFESSLYLDKNQIYRGRCVLIYESEHKTRIDELPLEGWINLARDIYTSETAIFKAFSPDHINIESLGNAIPHLHWHIIPRYKTDPRWGGPIWTPTKNEMQELYLDDKEYTDIVNEILQYI